MSDQLAAPSVRDPVTHTHTQRSVQQRFSFVF